MGWFDEQIKLRKDSDDKALSDSLKDVSAIIEGKKKFSYTNDNEEVNSVIGEILNHYGFKLKDIPEEVTDFYDKLDYACRPYGIMYRHVTLDKGWYKKATGAFLTTLKTGEKVAVLPNKFDTYEYRDPKTLKIIKINKQTQLLLEEDAYCFYKPFPQRKINVKDLVQYIVSVISPITFVQVVLLTLIGTLIGLLTPKLTKIIFSNIIESNSLQLLLGIAILYISIEISILLINSIKSLVMEKISTQMDVSVEAATMARILSLPATFFQKYNSGEVSSRSQYINSLCSVLVDTFLSTGLTSIFSLVYFTQIFKYAPMLVLPALCITIGSFLFSLLVTFKQMKITEELNLLSSEMTGMTYQIITGVQKIKLSGSEKRIFARWLKHYSKEANLTYNPPAIITYAESISTAITLIGTIVMYYFAVVSNVSVADYTAFNAAYGMLSGALTSIASIALTAATIKPTIEMAKPILETAPEISEGKQIVNHISGAIELSHVSFSYEENPQLIIDDLSLKINAGQYVAIVGKTGCGKSTILRLLLGFEKPQKGAIYYDGKDINTLDLKSLRKKIGAVTQNGKLFSGDIYSNIVISAPYLSMDDAWKAADIANIKDDIEQMPMGMFTMISEGEGGISGGQKQRLMIARAIAPNPKILMFDEATSALDNITQKKVSEALDSLKCTRIVIAHRLSTIKQCDRILVLDQGKIIEDGTYDELIEKNGYFSELVERQKLD